MMNEEYNKLEKLSSLTDEEVLELHRNIVAVYERLAGEKKQSSPRHEGSIQRKLWMDVTLADGVLLAVVTCFFSLFLWVVFNPGRDMDNLRAEKEREADQLNRQIQVLTEANRTATRLNADQTAALLQTQLALKHTQESLNDAQTTIAILQNPDKPLPTTIGTETRLSPIPQIVISSSTDPKLSQPPTQVSTASVEPTINALVSQRRAIFASARELIGDINQNIDALTQAISSLRELHSSSAHIRSGIQSNPGSTALNDHQLKLLSEWEAFDNKPLPIVPGRASLPEAYDSLPLDASEAQIKEDISQGNRLIGRYQIVLEALERQLTETEKAITVEQSYIAHFVK